MVIGRISSVQSLLPPLFDVQAVAAKFPFSQTSSILHQEINRYNSLLTIVKEDLAETLSAMEGKSEVKSIVEETARCLVNNVVPLRWQAPHLSAKGIAEWVDSLNERVDFFRAWAENGQPRIVRLSAFWNVRGFLRAAKAKFARESGCAFEDVELAFGFAENERTTGIERLYLENADWDPAKNILIESKPKQRYALMPIVTYFTHS